MACALFRWTLTRTRWLWTWRVCGVPSRRFDAQLELYQPLFSLAMGGQNTRLVVVAHLFGSRAPLDEVVSLARQHNLMVVEDAAEAGRRGPRPRRRSPRGPEAIRPAVISNIGKFWRINCRRHAQNHGLNLYTDSVRRTLARRAFHGFQLSSILTGHGVAFE